MHIITSVCLLVLAAKRCFAASLSASLPLVTHSRYTGFQNTTNGTSVVIPDSLVANLGVYLSEDLGIDLNRLKKMPLPRANKSKVWQYMTNAISGM